MPYLILGIFAVILFFGEASSRLSLDLYAMGGALLLILAFPLICGFLFLVSLPIIGGLIALVLSPFIALFRKLGLFKEKDRPEQAEAKTSGERTFEDALQMVRAFEAERKKRGFKPGWLFFQCKDDDLLLEALEYLRSTGEIPKSQRSKQKHSSQKEKTGTERNETKTECFDPYKILEVPSSASPQEIKSSYRHQMKLYHPDRVAHLGAALRELANRRTQDIQRAFETLMPQA